jgi:hypothetical protein
MDKNRSRWSEVRAAVEHPTLQAEALSRIATELSHCKNIATHLASFTRDGNFVPAPHLPLVLRSALPQAHQVDRVVTALYMLDSLTLDPAHGTYAATEVEAKLLAITASQKLPPGLSDTIEKVLEKVRVCKSVTATLLIRGGRVCQVEAGSRPMITPLGMVDDGG